MAECISLSDSIRIPAIENLSEIEALNLAYQYQCCCAVMEIMATEIFMQKKLLHAEYLAKQGDVSSKSVDSSTIKNPEASGLRNLEDIISSWSVSSVLSRLIKSLASCEHHNEAYFQAEVTL